jgi:hypothetical protein
MAILPTTNGKSGPMCVLFYLFRVQAAILKVVRSHHARSGFTQVGKTGVLNEI